MKAVKIILSLVVILVIAIGGFLFFGGGPINAIVKEVIETVGTDTLKASVRVNTVDIKPFEGKGSLKGFSIANPKGFSNNSIVSVGDVGLQIDTASVLDDVKVIKEIYIDAIALRAEQKNITDTNIQALINNLESTSSNSGSSNSSSDSESSNVRLMIESFRIGDSSIALETEKFGGRTVKLPGYTQKNIGDKENGLTPEQISKTIMDTLLSRAKKAVKGELENLLKGELEAKAKEKIEEAKQKAEEKLKDKLKEKLGDKVKAGDLEKLKGLF